MYKMAVKMESDFSPACLSASVGLKVQWHTVIEKQHRIELRAEPAKDVTGNLRRTEGGWWRWWRRWRWRRRRRRRILGHRRLAVHSWIPGDDNRYKD